MACFVRRCSHCNGFTGIGNKANSNLCKCIVYVVIVVCESVVLIISSIPPTTLQRDYKLTKRPVCAPSAGNIISSSEFFFCVNRVLRAGKKRLWSRMLSLYPHNFSTVNLFWSFSYSIHLRLCAPIIRKFLNLKRITRGCLHITLRYFIEFLPFSPFSRCVTFILLPKKVHFKKPPTSLEKSKTFTKLE